MSEESSFAENVTKLLSFLAGPTLPKEPGWKSFLRRCHLLKERKSGWLNAIKMPPEEAEKQCAEWQREMERWLIQAKDWALGEGHEQGN